MTQQIIGIGTTPNDGTGDTMRDGGVKINQNFTELYSALFPSGGIIMWSGSIATIPTGWVICDGTNSTPDLRGRFIVGAGSDVGVGVTFNTTTGAQIGEYAPNNTGGEVAHRLTIDEMPAHSHGYDLPGSNPVSGSPDNETVSTYNRPDVPQPTTEQTGGDNYHENRPPYYALAYIMKT